MLLSLQKKQNKKNKKDNKKKQTNKQSNKPTTTKHTKTATTYSSPLFTSQMEMLSGNCSE